MKDQIQQFFEESIKVKQDAFSKNANIIEEVVAVMLAALKQGNKILFCGNGGSAADSQHIAAEFIGRFKKERQSLAAVALTTDTSILTAIGNDYGFDFVFSRQVEGIANEGDVLVGISTSGNSKNVIEAVNLAKKMNVKTVSFTGNDGGPLGSLTDFHINVPSSDTARIQESHICIAHIICELVENNFKTSE
jgi:D-sedoheptulose 7-phosphate isomerase